MLEKKEIALEYLKKKCKQLQANLENTNLFLNMVIHDLRSPTTQIQYIAGESLKKMKELEKKHLDFQKQHDI